MKLTRYEYQTKYQVYLEPCKCLCLFHLQISDLKKRAERSRKDYLELRMTAEEEVILLRQQLVAIRNALRQSEKECEELRQGLEKEVGIHRGL